MNLKELQEAYRKGNPQRLAVAAVDNDSVTVYADGGEGECVFEMHPEEMLEEALNLLGIPWEHV